MTAPDEVSEDRFLGGKIVLRQTRKGYRAGVDPALLAASLELKPGSHAIELGCGPGAALLAAAVLNEKARLTGIESDIQAAGLARENIAANALEARVRVETGDVFDFTPDAPADAVFFNPPFFDDPAALRAPAEEKRAAWLTGHSLTDWIAAGARMLRPGGSLTLIHRADRLGEILTACPSAGFGSLAVRPVQPRAEKPAKRILVRAIKAGRAPLVLLPGFCLHDEGPGKYAPGADAVLRGEARLALAP